MDQINKQTANTQDVIAQMRDYALRRTMIALDRMIAGTTKEQRKKDVAWATLWHKHWKSLPTKTK